ncbi:MAG: glycosyltransferase family 8 protein [Syntrophaceae bacterium]|nr:glycosyltransferase family 8 protein [Syntrophaceae bacterium]
MVIGRGSNIKISVAYSCDELYIPHTGISILSLLENNKDIGEITIYLIHKNVSETSIEMINGLVKSYSRNFQGIPFDKICYGLNVDLQGRHIETIFTKLFLARIEGIDKILYIDSDTIINKSLIELWETNMDDYIFAGVNAREFNPAYEFKLNQSEPFINDGVVLINTEEFRKQNLIQTCLDYIADNYGKPPLLTEGIINIICNGKLKVIHPKFNLLSAFFTYKRNRFAGVDGFYSKEIIEEAINKPVIIHYLSAFYNRPWDVNCSHPVKDKYLYYKSISIWKDVPLTNSKLSLRLRLIRALYDLFPHDLLDFVRYVKNKIIPDYKNKINN